MNSIENLASTPKGELLEMWARLPGKKVSPPSRIDRLVRELAYRLQEQRHGRLDKNTSVALRRHSGIFEHSLREGGELREVATPSQLLLERGSVLTREWNGRRINVVVQGKRAFEWEGKRYRSLSSIAREVTGQHTSGPRFFGLRERTNG